MITLSQRQSDVLRLKASGMLDKQIAEFLGLSAETVKTHIRIIRLKFGVTGSFCGVVIKAERLGMLEGVAA